MKRLLTALIFVSLLILAACSKDKDAFDDRLQSYLTLWHEQKFEDMYKMTTAATQDSYDDAAFIDRYEKIYQDLGIDQLEIKPQDLTDEQKKEALKSGQVTLPLHVKMDSIAGPIDFTTNITFKKEKDKEEKENWLVDWNPGLIFPQLKDGGEIRIETEKPTRGEIIDRNQIPLAINSTAYEIGVVPERFSDTDTKELATILNMSKKQIEEALSANWVEPHLFVPIKKIPETDESTYNKALAINGVTYQETTGRVYPANEAAAHLVGYIGTVTADDLEKNKDGHYGPEDLIGKRGLEQLYEEKLRGETGVKIYVKTDDNEEIIAEQPVKDGETIQLTIDVNLQEKVFETYENDAGTAVVIDPKTGDTLALVSSPSFNPNKLLYGISQKEREALENDPKQPLINRFSATFAPGSVIKPVTASIGLNNGSIKPNEGLTIKGLTWSNGKGWGDYKVKRVSTSEKPVDLKDALIRSDNIYFAMQAVNMGHTSFEKGLETFGFSKDIPFDYPIKKSQISNSGDLSQEVLLANTSYGQGELEMSALHLALTYTPLFNEGSMLKPQLLIDGKKEVWQKDILSKEDINVLKKALREVVTNQRGTAHKLDTSSVDISGKTGTAELKSGKKDKNASENSWFVAYPTDKENILVAMMVEDTKGRGPLALEKVSKIINDWNK